jgi:LacI family transcriptional regulator
VSLLREEIGAGRFACGAFLPTVRELSRKHQLAPKTVLRALRELQAGGLVSVEPRQGYRVSARANDPDGGAPLAYVLSTREAAENWDAVHRQLLLAFQRAAMLRGWPLVGMSSGGRAQAEVVRQLLAMRACGVILDAIEPELIELVRKAGLPALMVDAWRDDPGLDAVVQDNHNGGALAAGHLAGRGHRRIGWFGPLAATSHSRERFGGAMAGLARAGLDLPPELRIEVRSAADAPAQARALLSRPDRPTGVVALWTDMAAALAAAARECGLALGRDLDIVGWSQEELYASDYRRAMGDGPVPPAVVWRVADMAEAALSRLAERRANPGMPVVQIRIPTRLELGDQREVSR